MFMDWKSLLKKLRTELHFCQIQNSMLEIVVLKNIELSFNINKHKRDF